jgi:hypothetical protein
MWARDLEAAGKTKCVLRRLSTGLVLLVQKNFPPQFTTFSPLYEGKISPKFISLLLRKIPCFVFLSWPERQLKAWLGQNHYRKEINYE